MMLAQSALKTLQPDHLDAYLDAKAMARLSEDHRLYQAAA
jgi:hypothetical protein